MLSGELFYYMASGPLCQHLFFVFAEFFSLAPAASILQLNAYDAVSAGLPARRVETQLLHNTKLQALCQHLICISFIVILFSQFP